METEITYKYVLGVDPGTTTGLSLVRFNVLRDGEPIAVWRDQLDWVAATDEIAKRCEDMRALREQGHSATVVVEKFQINAQTARKGQQGAEDALGMTGVARRECRLTGVPYAEAQQASAAKRLIDNEVLKLRKLYAPGLIHANDASRHVLLYAMKQKFMSPQWLVKLDES